MLYKPRKESKLLRSLKILNTRGSLTADEKKYYLNQEKGFKGEVQFDLLTERLQSDCLVINDLQLELNNTEFQIDTFIIQGSPFQFEVKNLEGDHYFENGNFYRMNRSEINNPLHQLNRSQNLLRQLLLKYGFNLPFQGQVIFINPAFTLYQAPKDQPITYPTQIDLFLKKYDNTTLKLNSWHERLADQLVSLHKEHSTHNHLPPYTLDGLKKGFTCNKCHSFSVVAGDRYLNCLGCGATESVESAVLRAVEELMLLFPDLKITTNVVYEWCGGGVVGSKVRIARILKKNFKAVGYGQWSYYE